MSGAGSLTQHWRNYLRDCGEVAATVNPPNGITPTKLPIEGSLRLRETWSARRF
mgnify:CR=1 FL=1